jgi:hypothetical protein
MVVLGTAEEISSIVRQLFGRTIKPRTDVDAITVLGCQLGTGCQWLARSMELLDAIGWPTWVMPKVMPVSKFASKFFIF